MKGNQKEAAHLRRIDLDPLSKRVRFSKPKNQTNGPGWVWGDKKIKPSRPSGPTILA